MSTHIKFYKICLSLLITLMIMDPVKVYANALNKGRLSTWLWNTEDMVQNQEGIINFLSDQGVDTLYLQVNYSIKIDQYRRFISKASDRGIRVYALEGGGNWIYPEGKSVEKEFYEWLTKYQNSVPLKERFKGIHFNVEPYMNPVYEKLPNIAIEGYQDFLISAINRSIALRLPMEVDIPFWFDEIQYSTKYGEGILLDWVLKNIKYVTVMAYRNNASGEDGIIQLVSDEMRLAEKYNNKVTIGVETQKTSEGNKLSFYGMKQIEMEQQLSKVFDYYRKYHSFNGFAIHDLKSWMTLDKKESSTHYYKR